MTNISEHNSEQEGESHKCNNGCKRILGWDSCPLKTKVLTRIDLTVVSHSVSVHNFLVGVGEFVGLEVSRRGFVGVDHAKNGGHQSVGTLLRASKYREILE